MPKRKRKNMAAVRRKLDKDRNISLYLVSGEMPFLKVYFIFKCVCAYVFACTHGSQVLVVARIPVEL